MSSTATVTVTDNNRRLEKRLKDREHEYTNYENFHILIGTFNVNNQQAPRHLLEEWLVREIKEQNQKCNVLPDIIAVGFQEIDTSSGAYIMDDKKKEDEWEFCVRKTLKLYEKFGDNKMDTFPLFDRVRLMGNKLKSFDLDRC